MRAASCCCGVDSLAAVRGVRPPLVIRTTASHVMLRATGSVCVRVCNDDEYEPQRAVARGSTGVLAGTLDSRIAMEL